MKHLLILTAALTLTACGGDSTPSETCAIEVTTPGVYRPATDLTLPEGFDCLIGVRVDGVTLDLTDRTLNSLGGVNRFSYGVFARGVSSLTVRGGTITGFSVGVALLDGFDGGSSVHGLVVEGVSVRDSGYMGLWLEGYGSLVKDNRISSVGGGSPHPLRYVYGITIIGRSCLLQGNEVEEVYPDRPSAEGVALSLQRNNSGCVLESNRVRQGTPTTDKNTFGVWVDVYSTTALRRNDITGMHYSGVVPPVTALEGNIVDRPIIHVITDRE